MPLFILLCVSATTIRRRNVDSVAVNNREDFEARSVRRLKGALATLIDPSCLLEIFRDGTPRVY